MACSPRHDPGRRTRRTDLGIASSMALLRRPPNAIFKRSFILDGARLGDNHISAGRGRSGCIASEWNQFFRNRYEFPIFRCLAIFRRFLRLMDLLIAFGVVWSADGVYLLTWRSSTTSPITQAFLDGYAKSLKSALRFADFPALHRVCSKTSLYGRWKCDSKMACRSRSKHPQTSGLAIILIIRKSFLFALIQLRPWL